MPGAIGFSSNRQSTVNLATDDDTATVADDLLSVRSRRALESKRLSMALRNMEQDSEHEFEHEAESWAGNYAENAHESTVVRGSAVVSRHRMCEFIL